MGQGTWTVCRSEYSGAISVFRVVHRDSRVWNLWNRSEQKSYTEDPFCSLFIGLTIFVENCANLFFTVDGVSEPF